MALRALALPQNPILPHRRDSIASAKRNAYSLCPGSDGKTIRNNEHDRETLSPRAVSRFCLADRIIKAVPIMIQLMRPLALVALLAATDHAFAQEAVTPGLRWRTPSG